ncbi:aldo/keto reductase [Catellatospora sichuanensis]|uniref:aldo/keto reductase n=1 Tax=Catellatospora sichuanensis TaxID=1969805 RepID=UPI00118324B8|nr:aldo/keto reductase [Catellatospora sichuanensis]
MTELNLALGTMHFGTRLDDKASFALLDGFVDGGGTIIDTADCYSFWADPSGYGGQSEAVIGRWLAARPGTRDRVTLSTKVGAEPTTPGDWPANRQGLSAAAIGGAVRGSLKRLGTEHVDVYWAHMEDRSVPLAETVAALGRLVDDGLVGRLGASNHPVWRVERARRIADVSATAGYSALQLRHSYVYPRPWATVPDQGHRFGWVTDEVLDYVAAEPSMSLWAYTALLNGAYTRDDRPLHEVYDHPGTARRLAALAEVARELGVSRNEVVLSWLVGGQPALTPIVGVSTPAQLDEALAGARRTLDPHLRRILDEPR